jgi:hypothetical protein
VFYVLLLWVLRSLLVSLPGRLGPQLARAYTITAGMSYKQSAQEREEWPLSAGPGIAAGGRGR